MKQLPILSPDIALQLSILEALDGAGHVSQRTLAGAVGTAPSSVNRIVKGLVDRGLVEVTDSSVRPYAYALTGAGRGYYKRLSHSRHASVVESFRDLEERIRRRLEELRARGIERVAFYGAGAVMELAYEIADAVGLEVVGVVDDDPARQGARPGQPRVEAPPAMLGTGPEAVVITSFRHVEEIRARIPEQVRESLRVVEL